jgi:hypothetical protein
MCCIKRVRPDSRRHRTVRIAGRGSGDRSRPRRRRLDIGATASSPRWSPLGPPIATAQFCPVCVTRPPPTPLGAFATPQELGAGSPADGLVPRRRAPSSARPARPSRHHEPLGRSCGKFRVRPKGTNHHNPHLAIGLPARPQAAQALQAPTPAMNSERCRGVACGPRNRP